MNTHLSHIVVLACALMITACNSQQYPLDEVAPGVFYHQGVHQEPSGHNMGAIANVGFIIGKRCVAVIDTGGSYAEGQNLRNAIRKHTELPVCYVINTHSHPDHIFGNAAFKSDNPSYIGHANLPAAMVARQDNYARSFQDILGDVYQGTEFILPTRLVNVATPLTIDLGERSIILTAYAPSHTDHDLTVFDKTTQTLWTGDLLFVDRIPVLDGNLNGWINTMQQLQNMSVNTVVPGHGTAASDDKWQAALANQLDYFISLRQQVRNIIADFGTIDDAISQVKITDKQKWLLFDEYHSRNVTTAFAQLEWE